MTLDLNELNEYGVPLHACNGYRHDEHYWCWVKARRLAREARLCRPRPQFADFHAVESKHAAVHKRLINWSISMGGGSRDAGIYAEATMFELYESTDLWQDTVSVAPPCDTQDAQRVNTAMQKLMEPHRIALTWAYCTRRGPTYAMERVGTKDPRHLLNLLNDGRTAIAKLAY